MLTGLSVLQSSKDHSDSFSARVVELASAAVAVGFVYIIVTGVFGSLLLRHNVFGDCLVGTFVVMVVGYILAFIFPLLRSAWKAFRNSWNF